MVDARPGYLLRDNSLHHVFVHDGALGFAGDLQDIVLHTHLHKILIAGFYGAVRGGRCKPIVQYQGSAAINKDDQQRYFYWNVVGGNRELFFSGIDGAISAKPVLKRFLGPLGVFDYNRIFGFSFCFP